MNHKLTEKQERFVDYYIETAGNATEAARKSGYAKSTCEDAPSWLNPRETQFKPYLKEAIDARLAELKTKRTADATEVVEYLTSVMRGEPEDEAVVVVGLGDGVSQARKVNVKVSTRDRTKAAELLGRVYGLYTDKVKLEDTPTPVIIDDLDGDADG